MLHPCNKGLYLGLYFLFLQAVHGFRVPSLIRMSSNDIKIPLLTNIKKLTVLGLLSLTLSTQNLKFDQSTHELSPVSIAQADSTGKFSTKLTARKRYLPRINTGVTEFKTLTQAKVPSVATLQFVDTTLPNLERAMGLYGLSLRKGETPDEISRTAERLTEVFAQQAGSALGATVKDPTKYAVQLSKATAALEEYLKFAGLPGLSSADYNPK